MVTKDANVDGRPIPRFSSYAINEASVYRPRGFVNCSSACSALHFSGVFGFASGVQATHASSAAATFFGSFGSVIANSVVPLGLLAAQQSYGRRKTMRRTKRR